ncbi:hypothetical protein Hanom_Chr08g00728291 [Helianthus anomalus]
MYLDSTCLFDYKVNETACEMISKPRDEIAVQHESISCARIFHQAHTRSSREVDNPLPKTSLMPSQDSPITSWRSGIQQWSMFDKVEIAFR